MKAIKRPNPIEVIQINKMEDMSGIPFLRADEINLEVYCQLHNTWIKFKFGDYINVTNPSDMYPIDQHVFESSYDIIKD